MKSIVYKGDDFLSAEETLGCLLDELKVIGTDKNDVAIITKDIIIEVRIKRNKSYNKNIQVRRNEKRKIEHA